MLMALVASFVALPAAAGEAPAAGKFLIAADGMRDPNFVKTVVLLARYGPHGALGVVLNRPTDVRLSQVFTGITGPVGGQLVYGGGPVQRGEWGMLLRAKKAPANALHVFDDVYLSDDNALLEKYVADKKSRDRFRVYSGYAGWGPGQLDAEIARGGWHVIPAERDIVFSPADDETWRELLPRDPREWTRLLAPGEHAVGVIAERNR